MFPHRSLTITRQSLLYNTALQTSAAGIPSSHEGLPCEHIARDLCWYLSIDSPLTPQASVDMSVETALLHEAMQSPDIAEVRRWASLDDTIFSPVLAYGNATQLLLPSGTSSLPIPGEYVAFVPTPQSLVLVGADQPLAIARAAELIEFFHDEHSLLSLQPIIGSDGSWRPFDPPVDHPAHDACARLGVLDSVAVDKAQREALASVVDPPLRLAELEMHVSDRSLITLCSWPEDADALLPKADAIRFLGSEGRDLIVGWDDVVAVVGSRLLKVDHTPPRWLTGGHPMREELAALDLYRIRLPPE